MRSFAQCHHRNRKLSRMTVDELIAHHFARPNRAIMVTDRFMRSRKFGPRGEQLCDSLSDFEIRDLFNHGRGNYGMTWDDYNFTYGGPGNPESTYNMQPRNNLCLYCSKTGRQCEWISFGGPYGYTSMEPITTSPTTGRIAVKQLILQSKPTDTIWLLELNIRTNTWRTIGEYPSPTIRQPAIVGEWPNFSPWQSS